MTSEGPVLPFIKGPIGTNPAQYHRICQRRKERLHRELVRPSIPRQKYLHESRHKHAINRVRGAKGRFVNVSKGTDANAEDKEGQSQHDSTHQWDYLHVSSFLNHNGEAIEETQVELDFLEGSSSGGAGLSIHGGSG
mmetsp:Transcript_57300/g.127896  ORF Transcript_57300/g.127896 Transcript_57300/m.127896 type:complete len:137 (-) Transcript_57300:348-758(-)